MLCEVCHQPVDLLADYADALAGEMYSPREYIEHQLHMSEDEKELRLRFFTEMLERHNAEKGANGN